MPTEYEYEREAEDIDRHQELIDLEASLNFYESLKELSDKPNLLLDRDIQGARIKKIKRIIKIVNNRDRSYFQYQAYKKRGRAVRGFGHDNSALNSKDDE